MRVRFTRPAQADLQQIHAYVSKDNPAEASRLVARLIERARAIGDTPHAGRATDEPNARVIVVPQLRYFIFYTFEDNEVHIPHPPHLAPQTARLDALSRAKTRGATQAGARLSVGGASRKRRRTRLRGQSGSRGDRAGAST